MIISIGIYSINRPEAGYGRGALHICIYIYICIYICIHIYTYTDLHIVAAFRGRIFSLELPEAPLAAQINVESWKRHMPPCALAANECVRVLDIYIYIYECKQPIHAGY